MSNAEFIVFFEVSSVERMERRGGRGERGEGAVMAPISFLRGNQ